MSRPAHRFLSLGAGVQSSTLLLLGARGAIPAFDAAVFADTGWEPSAVYRHLRRLAHIAKQAGIPLVRVSAGNIRADALDPAHRFASMPLFTLGRNGTRHGAAAVHHRIQDQTDQGGGASPARLPAPARV